MTRFAVLVVVFACAGCVLNRTPVVPERDTGGLDTGRLDTGNFDTGGLDGGHDAGMDAPLDVPPGVDTGIDTGFDTGFDAGMDAGMDAGTDTGVDTGVDAPTSRPDTGVDAPVRDTGVDAPVRQTCDELFGGQPMYMACPLASGETMCAFYVNPEGPGQITCATACGSHMCLGARRTSGDCMSDGTPSGDPCTNPSSERICICSRD